MTLLSKFRHEHEELPSCLKKDCIHKVITLQNKQFAVLKVGESDPARNFVCADESGNVKWYAEARSREDFYVDFELAEDVLRARTWDGYEVDLDTSSGRILKMTHLG